MPFYRRQLKWQDLEHNSKSSIFRTVSYGVSIFRCFMLASSLGSPSLPFRVPGPQCICCFCQPHLSFLAHILCNFYVLLLFPAFQAWIESLPADAMGLETGNLFELIIIVFLVCSLEIKGYFGI